jgi:glycosyltransferase involved in cell wall biosynthesis
MLDQYNTKNMSEREFVDRIQYFVYVSEWQKQQFENKFPTPFSQNIVIKNAIEPIPFKEKSTDKIRLIYTSTPTRGLSVLLDSFEILNRDDVELHIYSSNIIYGKGYQDMMVGTYKHLHRCKIMKNVVYKGFALNKAVRKAVQDAHILAYPSIYEETSCLAAIEAGAAGCKIVTTNLGALPETCDKWATFVDYKYGDDLKELSKNYADVLNTEINNFQTTNIKEQSDWFNNYYSWNNRAEEWNNLIEQIKNAE